MAISQSGYAGEFIDKDRNATKFDDIGCMIRFVRDNHRRDTIVKFFVMDYNDKHWLEAQNATYVKSGKTASPMASGLTAFHDPSSASAYAAKNDGMVLRFDDLWKADIAEPVHIPAKIR
jgi:copper chaperone NosL